MGHSPLQKKDTHSVFSLVFIPQVSELSKVVKNSGESEPFCYGVGAGGGVCLLEGGVFSLSSMEIA